MEAELVASGRFVRIETRGAISGLSRTVTVGFADDDLPGTATPGALLVAAGSSNTAWAMNLLSDPACRVHIGERSFDAVAEPLDADDPRRDEPLGVALDVDEGREHVCDRALDPRLDLDLDRHQPGAPTGRRRNDGPCPRPSAGVP